MIRSQYFEDSFVDSFAAAFRARTSKTFVENGAQLRAAVFPVAVWPEFLEGGAVAALKTELTGMDFRLKSSDLYEFHQTTDLKHADASKHPLIAQICKELYSKEFLNVMQRITGRKLGGHVDISGQRYQRGDFLLCHDDRLERRRIALILYLVPEDAEMLGGRLWAMRADEEGRPVTENPEIVPPKWNTLAFFEVTRASFHQVEQVLSEDVFRYSITCWFHDADEAENAGDLQENVQKLPLALLNESQVAQVIKDILTLGKEAFRLHFKGKFLSLAQYSDCEPSWMKCLLSHESAIKLEEHFGVALDWPTRPVAFLLAKGDFYLDSGVDRQGDFEYNYRERSLTQSTQKRLSVTISVELDANNQPTGKPSLKTHFEPLKIIKFDSEKLLLICLKFSIVNDSLRFIEQ